jgi:hypothetical protein
MCESSKVADDWVTKGFHIHVDGVELNVYTDHRGRIDFRSFFSLTPAARVEQAIRTVYERCLPDPAIRGRWIQRLKMASVFMLTYQGALESLANGRMLEFKFLRIAIERWENHGDL